MKSPHGSVLVPSSRTCSHLYSLVSRPMSGSSSDSVSTVSLARKRAADKALPCADDPAYAEMIQHIEASMVNTITDNDPVRQKAAILKKERDEFKQQTRVKTEDIDRFSRKSQRLRKRASNLTDNGLLMEYARRQATKVQVHVKKSSQ